MRSLVLILWDEMTNVHENPGRISPAAAREAADHLTQALCSPFLGNVLTSTGVQDFGFGIVFFLMVACLKCKYA